VAPTVNGVFCGSLNAINIFPLMEAVNRSGFPDHFEG
jgi:hypothetical protein